VQKSVNKVAARAGQQGRERKRVLAPTMLDTATRNNPAAIACSVRGNICMERECGHRAPILTLKYPAQRPRYRARTKRSPANHWTVTEKK
jgi:hypothetical protein